MGYQVKSAADLAPYQGCSADADCVYAQNGVCDCGNGGAATAVNKSMLAKFNSSFDTRDVSCTLLVKIPPCESGTAACKAGLCEFTPAAQ